MNLMSEIFDKSFFKEGDGEKVHFTTYLPRKHKRMYEWLRKSYPDSPITKELQKAMIEKIEALNAAAPNPFQDAG